MTTTLTTLLAACAAALLIVAPPTAEAAASGSGRVVAETRAVGPFDAIVQSGSIDIVVRQAAHESVEVRAEDNLLPLIETVVEQRSEGPTLAIRIKRGEHIVSHKPIQVTVDVVHLRRLATAGSGDVMVQALKTPALRLSMSGASDAKLIGLATDSLEIHIAGSGDVAASGSARQLALHIAGSGDADLAALVSDDAEVHIAGSGDAGITANKSLAVSVAGSGDVTYGGAVTAVRSAVAGSGSIRHR